MAPRRRSAALVTVLFTDIVGSTEIAAELGDRRWRELMTRHHRIVRAALRRHGGREVDTAGDGVLSSFDRPEAALRCAWAIVGEMQALGIDVRAGVHVGQAEVIDGKIGGLVLHAGARIAALAGPAEVLASRTLTELVPGSGFRFEDRGVHTLKGVPGQHQVLAVSSLAGEDLPSPLAPEEAASRRADITPAIVPRRTGLVLAGVGVLLAIALVWVLFPETESEPREQGLPPSTLVRIDPSTNRVVDTIRRTPPVGGSGDTHGRIQPEIVAGGGVVWVNAGVTFWHVDPTTQRGHFGRDLTTNRGHRGRSQRRLGQLVSSRCRYADRPRHPRGDPQHGCRRGGSAALDDPAPPPDRSNPRFRMGRLAGRPDPTRRGRRQRHRTDSA